MGTGAIKAFLGGAREIAKKSPKGTAGLTEQVLNLARKQGNADLERKILQAQEEVDEGIISAGEFSKLAIETERRLTDPKAFAAEQASKLMRIRNTASLVNNPREGRIPYMNKDDLKIDYLQGMVEANAVDDLLRASNDVRLLIEGHKNPFLPATRDHSKWSATKIPDWMKDPDYQRTYKGEDMQVVRMTPHQYLQHSAGIFSKEKEISPRELFKQRLSSGKEEIQKLMTKMIRGEPLDMPWLDYVNGGQEGLHRAIAAERLGIPHIDVAVFKPMGNKNTPDVGEE